MLLPASPEGRKQHAVQTPPFVPLGACEADLIGQCQGKARKAGLDNTLLREGDPHPVAVLGGQFSRNSPENQRQHAGL